MATTSRLTLDEFLRQPETKPASEYACGEAFQKPMPNRHHAAIQFFFAMVLGPFLEQTRIGQAFTEFRCIFGPPGDVRTYVPDLSFVSNERLTSDLHLHTAPDLAIEIRSPDEPEARLRDKITFYLRYGVRLVWVIDPATLTVTVEAPGVATRVLRPGDTLDGGEVLPGFSVAVDAIFARMQV